MGSLAGAAHQLNNNKDDEEQFQSPHTSRCTTPRTTPRSPRYVPSSTELIQMAMHQLVEIQEAQRSLADQFNVLLTAIGEAQHGRMDNLQLLTSGSFVKLVPSEKLEEYESMRDKIVQLERINTALTAENHRMKFASKSASFG
eukprot:TRINITY_DN28380_c1_g1_i1.p2 TRINITY_DN28380_c1_g1~~TRINITY_DN28380_c1_g1_i1.p2  ORF type:complete len:143 (+),score=24.88 TRINITY_DN28380_c1_g1_i1:19-447(+)